LATHSTGLDLARLERALRCLLSPLSGDASAWPAAACAAVRDVFEVEGTGHLYFVRGADPRPTILHSDASPVLVEQYNAVADHDVSSQRIQAQRVEVAHPYTVMDREEYLRSTAYQEVFRPHEIGGFVSLLLPSEAGLTARLSVASTALLEPSQAERALASARVLLPAFRAGFTQWHQLGAPAGTLARSLDALADGVLVCDSAGRPRHENTALVALLAGEPGAALVRAAAHDLARGVGALGSASGRRTGSAASLAPPAVERVVPAGGGAYRLRATLVVSGTFGDDPMVLVTVGLVASPGAPAYPPDPPAGRGTPGAPADAAAVRFGLTAQELAVARLMAERRTDAEIGAALGISPNTARTHAERVRRKLGVARRTEVAAALGRG
jgi:DNA-binding CsgD family transcriptional regulator/PAS domain-containing protein